MFQSHSSLPPSRPINHAIDIILGYSLPNAPLYQNLITQNDEIKHQIEYLLVKGFIKLSVSPLASHVLLVLKKDGSWHFCIDFHALNKIIIKNIYPLPCIDDLIDQLQGAKFFTKLDLKNGYHQI